MSDNTKYTKEIVDNLENKKFNQTKQRYIPDIKIPRDNKASLQRKLLSEEIKLKFMEREPRIHGRESNIDYRNRHIINNSTTLQLKKRRNTVPDGHKFISNQSGHKSSSGKVALYNEVDRISTQLTLKREVNSAQLGSILFSEMTERNRILTNTVESHESEIETLRNSIMEYELGFKAMEKRQSHGVSLQSLGTTTSAQSIKLEIINNKNQSKLDLEFEKGRNFVKIEKMQMINDLKNKIDEKHKQLEEEDNRYEQRELLASNMATEDLHSRTMERIKEALYGVRFSEEQFLF